MGFLKDELSGFIPQEQATEIIKQTTEGSIVMKLARTEQMTSDNKKFPVLTSKAGAYWVGEGERIKTSGATWIFPKLEAKKLGVIIPVTKEKLNDASVDVFGELKEQIAEAFYTAIDSAALFGTNSPFSTNIFKSISTAGNTITAGTGATYDLDVSDAMALVEGDGYDVKAFAAKNGVKNTLRKLRDANGNQLLANGVGGNEFYNVPIEFARNGWDATKADLIGGDFSKYAIFGIRDGIEYEILKEATLQGTVGTDNKPISLAEQDMIAIKATMRVGFLVVRDDAFCAVVPKVEAETPSDPDKSNEGSNT